MKTIDVKSMIIGVLLTTTVIFGMGATGKADAGKWDDKQVWEVSYISIFKGKIPEGWEPVVVDKDGDWGIRKRIK